MVIIAHKEKRKTNKDLHHKQWEGRLGGKKEGRRRKYSTSIENYQIFNHIYDLSALFGNTVTSYKNEETKELYHKESFFLSCMLLKYLQVNTDVKWLWLVTPFVTMQYSLFHIWDMYHKTENCCWLISISNRKLLNYQLIRNWFFCSCKILEPSDKTQQVL